MCVQRAIHTLWYIKPAGRRRRRRRREKKKKKKSAVADRYLNARGAEKRLAGVCVCVSLYIHTQEGMIDGGEFCGGRAQCGAKYILDACLRGWKGSVFLERRRGRKLRSGSERDEEEAVKSIF